MEDHDSSSDQPNIQVNRISSTPPKSSGRSKDEIQPSIPWQRRDMSRKEEYEFLELNPFSDLSEFSQRYPHVHQRTYYRWKRRIKEEYILLEQCPHMSFEQFSSVVLQAKLSVFNLWKSLINQGKGFFAPSDVSKRLEAKCPTSKAVNTLSEQYTYLQKNLSCSEEQFCQQFSNTSTEVFIALKRKVIQEFWVFYHNQHLDWKEFSKLVDISEEIYKVWKDQDLLELNSVLSSFSSNAQIAPSQYHSFQNTSDPQTQLLKGNLPAFDTSLEETVSRSLSASYLSSVQNLMFPWASYYGLHGPLNQQILPMMLWPRMLGMNRSTPNPLNLPSTMASSPSSCGSKAESPQDINTSAAPSNSASHISHQCSKFEKIKLPSISKEMEEQGLLGMKRSSSIVLNRNENAHESDSSKKQKLKDDLDNTNTQSPVSKSRKQNKQEYIYYLKNPSLTFKDLETLFPTISLRTFYRWRKEMNAALLFIQEKRNPDYEHFKTVFPDIPEEVFQIWKAKSGKENFAEKLFYAGNEHNGVENFEYSLKEEEVGKDSLEYSDGKDNVSYEEEIKSEPHCLFRTTTPQEKQRRDIRVFVHQNPNADFESVSQMFPGISSHSFYHWKKEWKDGIDFLLTNPGISYENYKRINVVTTEEIFEAWKTFLQNLTQGSKEMIHCKTPSVVETKVDAMDDGSSVKKLNVKEFTYLQLNPQIEFDCFIKIFPYVQDETFHQWKKEVLKIINYIRSQPSVNFEEISAVIPDVSEEAFFKWKELIACERPTRLLVEDVKRENESNAEKNSEENDAPSDISLFKYDEEAKTKMTNALLHLMHNPNVEYRNFYELFPFVSIETFELWLQRIKAVILHISSNPSLEFEEFRSAITDIGEDIFQKWKSLTHDEISAIGKQISDTSTAFMPKTSNESYEFHRTKALYFCQENPDITFESFSSQYCNISETDFKCWMLKISTQISFIRDNEKLTYEDFKGIYPDVDRAIFDLWKSSPLNGSPFPNFIETSTKEVIYRSSHVKGENNSPAIETTNNSKLSYDNSSDLEKESSLKQLCKLAESDPSHGRWKSKNTAEISGHGSDMFANVLLKQSSNTSAEFGSECHQNINSDQVYNCYMPKNADAMSAQNTAISSPLSEKWHSKMERTMEHYDSISYSNQENQSLSALMAMSANCHSSSSGKWKNNPSSSGKEDEEMFSSQRQKKMSRAEYLFVKDNPDVDSQEFARIFPGVSARTFYRWKKEIKAQMQTP